MELLNTTACEKKQTITDLENVEALKRAVSVRVGCLSVCQQPGVVLNRQIRTEYGLDVSVRIQHPWLLQSSSWRAQCR